MRKPDLDVHSAGRSAEGEGRGALPHGKCLADLVHCFHFDFIQILFFKPLKNIGLDLLLTTWLSSCDREIPDAYFPICGGKNQMPPKENGMSLNNEWFDKWLSKS